MSVCIVSEVTWLAFAKAAHHSVRLSSCESTARIPDRTEIIDRNF